MECGATVKRYLIVQSEGNRDVQRAVEHYNLQAIIAVGFKIENQRAVQFRADNAPSPPSKSRGAKKVVRHGTFLLQDGTQ